MGRVMRQSVFRVICGQLRLRSCAHPVSQLGVWGTVLPCILQYLNNSWIWIVNAQIRLRECTGWSGPALTGHATKTDFPIMWIYYNKKNTSVWKRYLFHFHFLIAFPVSLPSKQTRVKFYPVTNANVVAILCVNWEDLMFMCFFFFFFFFFCCCCLFVCVEVLRLSQPNGVMSSAVSLPNHTFTGQA